MMLIPHPDYIRKIVIQEDKENRELFNIDIALIPDDVPLDEYLSDTKISIYLGNYLFKAISSNTILSNEGHLTAVDVINCLQQAIYYFKLSLKEKNEKNNFIDLSSHS